METVDNKVTKVTKRSGFRKALIQNLVEGQSISKACELSGVTRMTYYRWYKDKKFREEIEKAKESRIHIIEDSLFNKAKEGNVSAIMYYLNNRAPDRWRSNNNTAVSFGQEMDESIEKIAELFKD